MKITEKSTDGSIPYSLDMCLGQLADILRDMGIESFSMTETALDYIVSEENLNQDLTRIFSMAIQKVQTTS